MAVAELAIGKASSEVVKQMAIAIFAFCIPSTYSVLMDYQMAEGEVTVLSRGRIS